MRFAAIIGVVLLIGFVVVVEAGRGYGNIYPYPDTEAKVYSGFCGMRILTKPTTIERNLGTLTFDFIYEDFTKTNDYFCPPQLPIRHRLVASCPILNASQPDSEIGKNSGYDGWFTYVNVDDHGGDYYTDTGVTCRYFSLYGSQTINGTLQTYAYSVESSNPPYSFIPSYIWRDCKFRKPLWMGADGRFEARLDCSDNRVYWVSGECASHGQELTAKVARTFLPWRNEKGERVTLEHNSVLCDGRPIFGFLIRDLTDKCTDWFFGFRRWLGTEREPWKCD